MKPNGQDERPPLDRALAYRRGLKFLRALQEGGDEAFNLAWADELPAREVVEIEGIDKVKN